MLDFSAFGDRLWKQLERAQERVVAAEAGRDAATADLAAAALGSLQRETALKAAASQLAAALKKAEEQATETKAGGHRSGCLCWHRAELTLDVQPEPSLGGVTPCPAGDLRGGPLLQAASESQRVRIAELEAAREALTGSLAQRGAALAGAVRRLAITDLLLRGLPPGPSAKVSRPLQ